MTHELSDRAKALLDRALLEEEARVPGSAQRVHLKRALLQGVALGAATSVAANAQAQAVGAAAAASKGFTLLTFAKGLAVGLALSATLGGGARWLSAPHEAPTRSAADSARAPRMLPKPEGSAAPQATPLAEPTEPAPTLVSQLPFAEPSARRRPSEPTATRGEPPALGAELQLMNAAQTALRDGRANEALELLGRYDLEFPRGQLRSERLAAEVVAACQLGLRERARRAADQLLLRDSSQVLTDRVKRSCAF